MKPEVTANTALLTESILIHHAVHIPCSIPNSSGLLTLHMSSAGIFGVHPARFSIFCKIQVCFPDDSISESSLFVIGYRYLFQVICW